MKFLTSLVTFAILAIPLFTVRVHLLELQLKTIVKTTVAWYVLSLIIKPGTKDDFVEHHNHFHGVSSHQDVHFPCDICGNSYPLVDSSTVELESYAEHWLQHFFMHE